MKAGQHRAMRRQSMLAGGFVGVLLLTASSLTLWPRADESAAAAPLVAPVTGGKIASTTVLKTARQIPLTALPFNPFARGAAAASSEVDRPQLLAAVQKLHLDNACCIDAKHTCTINGRPYAEGDRVDKFVIESITTTAATLKNGLYRFELRVQQ